MPSSRKRKQKSSRSEAPASSSTAIVPVRAKRRWPPKGESLEKRLRRHFPKELPQKLPQHVAIIMDGNGRWAKARGLPRYEGHREGAQSVGEIVAISREVGIRYLTLYAFSAENWRRPHLEVQALMLLLDEYLDAELPEMLEYGIALQTIGDTERLPRGVRNHLNDVIKRTAGGKEMTLVLALSYGGRQEIIRMARDIAEEARLGRLQPRQINENYVSQHLYTAGIPDPDLLIRTAGEYRLSNFLLWQSAYTELYVTKANWPDFRRKEYVKALRDYAQRERRYGLTSEQIAEKKP